MIKKSQRLQVIQNLAIKKEDEAAIELGKSNTRLSMMQNQLAKLYQYREEYSRQFNEAGADHLKSSSLQDYVLFINNLNTGINRLLQSIEEQKKICEQVRLFWLDKHKKVDIYHKVNEKYKLEESIERNKQEQKLNDEASTAFYLRKNLKL